MDIEAYEAFRNVGVPDDKAMRAAIVLGKRGSLGNDVRTITWMVGITLALLAAILIKLMG